MLAIAELLVARRFVGHLELTRLPVGHIHEDIDSFDCENVSCVDATACSFHECKCQTHSRSIYNGDLKLPVEVVDIVAVSDYVSCFESYIDPKLSRYAKLALTQLQW